MVSESAKKRAKIEFIERFDELLNKIDKDWKIVKRFSGSLEEILEKSSHYKSNYQAEMNNLENTLFIPYKLTSIDIGKCWQDIILHSHGFTMTIIALGTIKHSKCNQCKSQLTKDNCYVYTFETKNITKWAVEIAQNFNWHGFVTLFCSPSCFQKSIYYKIPNKNSDSSREREREQNPRVNL